MSVSGRTNLVRVGHRRGMALILAMVVVVTSVVLSVSFLNGQARFTVMAQNVVQRASARGIAESGLTLAFAYIKTEPNWRTAQTNGAWLTDHSIGGGTFKIRFEDEQDGDLANAADDPVTLTCVGSLNGVTHEVRAVLAPQPPAIRVLFVVPDATSLGSQDADRLALMQGWGWIVTLITASEPQTSYDAAVAANDVAYVTEEVSSADVNTKLNGASIGVVNEDGSLYDDISFATVDATWLGTSIDITNNMHFITSPFSIGSVTITSGSTELRSLAGTLAPGGSLLAEQSLSSNSVLMVIEAGAILSGGGGAAGRRVSLPWAGSGLFDFNLLNSNGRTILNRAVKWAAQPVTPTGPIAHWTLDETAGATAGDAVGGYDGTYTNGVSLGSNGISGTAASFDGTDDFVEVAHDDDFLLDSGTVSLWFRTDSPSALQGILSKDSNSYDSGGHLSISTDTTMIRVRLQSNTTSYYVWSNAIVADTWYHVVFTFGPNGMKLYIDGVLVDTDPYTGGLGTTSGGTGNYEPMLFGAATWLSGDLTISGWTDPFSGVIDDIYFFDHDLSAAEVQQVNLVLSRYSADG